MDELRLLEIPEHYTELFRCGWLLLCCARCACCVSALCMLRVALQLREGIFPAGAVGEQAAPMSALLTPPVASMHIIARTPRRADDELTIVRAHAPMRPCRLDDPIGGVHMNVMKAGCITAHRIVAVSHGWAGPPARANKLRQDAVPGRGWGAPLAAAASRMGAAHCTRLLLCALLLPPRSRPYLSALLAILCMFGTLASFTGSRPSTHLLPAILGPCPPCSYAWECQTQEGGWGLDAILRDQAWKLRGERAAPAVGQGGAGRGGAGGANPLPASFQYSCQSFACVLAGLPACLDAHSGHAVHAALHGTGMPQSKIVHPPTPSMPARPLPPGVVNGIDYNEWSPATDQFLQVRAFS